MAQHTESAVLIEGSADAVLDVIADLEAYPQWAKGLREVEVLTEDDGWADQARFVLDAGILKDDYVLRYTWDVEEDSTGVVSWQLVRAHTLTAMDGSYTLTAESGGTRVIYRLAVDVSVPLPGMMRRKAERSIVETALSELKTRVESLAR